MPNTRSSLVLVAARALHKYECEAARRKGGTKGIDWVNWKRLPEFAQARYLRRASAVVKALKPVPAQDKNLEALNAEIAYLRQANLTMAKERDAWKDTALAHKARLDEFAVAVRVKKPRRPEGPITTGIHTYAAPDGTYAASAKSLTVTGYRSRSGARHAMIRLLAEA